MKVLFATKNPAKIKKFSNELKLRGIEVITIKDLDFELDIEENGKNAIENAYLKAVAYYEKTKIPTIGMDNNLYIENLPEEKQPGTHVRRVNGKTLTDDEMIEHYTKMVKDNGGKLVAKWVYGIVICNGNKNYEFTWSKDNFYFVDKPCTKINPGYPLDSITIIPEYNKYLAELTIEEKNIRNKNDNNDEIIDFIENSLKSD